MTFILAAQASPVSPEAPTVAPANDVRSDGGATFGPTLSDARSRLSSTDARRADDRSGAADRRSSQAPPEARSNDTRSDQPANDTRTEGPTRSDTVETRTDQQVDEASEEAGEEAGEEAALAEATEPLDAEGSMDSNEAIAGALASTTTSLPTAKGATGDGGPSIDLTIEAAAAPDATGVPTDNTVIIDGVTVVDLESMATPVVESSSATVAEMGRQAALTSLEQVSDVDLSLAERIRPATTDEVAGPTVLSEDPTRSDPFADAPVEATTVDAPLHERARELSAERGDAVEPTTEVGQGEVAAVTPVDGAIAEGEAVDRLTQQTSIGNVTRADSPDAVVVLARDATAAPDNVRTGPTTTTPTSAPLPEAEANLWEDVRSAFDRIRSTVDGQEVRMRLRPAELGELLVQVRTQGDQVSVRLVASSAGAHQTLMDDRVRLAAELARAGFDEGSVDISQSDAGGSSRGGNNNQEGGDTDRRSLGNVLSTNRIGSARETFERREPIRTESGFRPGRTAQSTINLTL